MSTMQLYKISYDYYEGEHEETLLAKDVDKEQFDKDIMEAKDYAQSLIGLKYKKSNFSVPYSVEYLPEFYNKIVDYLETQKGYVEIHTNDDVCYEIDDRDLCYGKKEITITKVEVCRTRKDGKSGGKFIDISESEI